ncbi:MAG: cation:proton antiporter regulatory subunit [Gaiellaceae bacterium]
MPGDIQETRLPGIGTKFTFRLDAGDRVTVIQHNDGTRELYYFRRADDPEPRAVIRLDDDEARHLGAVIGGAYERPKIVEDLELALGELTIEWISVPDSSPYIGKTLAECGFRAQAGITVIAILREPEPVTGARPEDVVQRGDTLVTVGKARDYGAFRRMLVAGLP